MPLLKLRSLCGKLVSMESCMYGCRVFMRELFWAKRPTDMLTKRQALSVGVQLGPDAMWELHWWQEHIGQTIRPIHMKAGIIEMTTDASDYAVGAWDDLGAYMSELLPQEEPC